MRCSHAGQRRHREIRARTGCGRPAAGPGRARCGRWRLARSAGSRWRRRCGGPAPAPRRAAPRRPARSAFRPPPQDAGGVAHLCGSVCGGAGTGSGAATTPPSSHDVSDGRISVAICPGGVRAACTATAASAPTVAGRGGGAHPGRDAARPALGVGGQRRVVRAVVGRLVADDVDDRRLRAARVVQVGEAVGEARAAMQQRRRRLAPPCARSRRRRRSRRPPNSASTQRMPGDAVERGDEVHLADVPGLAKQVSTPLPSSVRTRLSAPFILSPLRPRWRQASLDPEQAHPSSGSAATPRTTGIAVARRPPCRFTRVDDVLGSPPSGAGSECRCGRWSRGGRSRSGT